MAAHLRGFAPIDQSTDFAAFLRQDSEGRLGWSEPPQDPLPGQFWNALLAADPSLRPNVLSTLADGVVSPDKNLRLHALRVMQHVLAAENLAALTRAFRRQPAAFVGISTGVPPATLFTEWLYAVAANQLEDRQSAADAIRAAAQFWSLPEAGSKPLDVLVSVAPDVAIAESRTLINGDVRKVPTLLNGIDFSRFPDVANALANEDANVRQQTGTMMKDALQPFLATFGASVWQQCAAALNVPV